jgi:phosphoribosylformylglycinamidine synthase I
VAQALELAGATAEIVPLNSLRAGDKHWSDYQILVVPGGFSYADALGAGRLLALDLNAYFSDAVNQFVRSGKPVIGICNGFQALVKAGILPGEDAALPVARPREATLTFNARGHFECRWVQLAPRSQRCIWTRGLPALLECPVAHGEGNFTLADPLAAARLLAQDQVALLYAGEDGLPAQGGYPANPNGSTADIAGVCNSLGNVLGLMPHPEDHIFKTQHPRWTRGETQGNCLALFTNGVAYASQI